MTLARYLCLAAPRIHQDCAIALQEKGDYDKAVKHYIDGTHHTQCPER